MADDLTTKFDRFADQAERAVHSHPWLVVVLMHEYFRNLYPTDPYVPFPPAESAVDRVSGILDVCISALEVNTRLGSYFDRGSGAMSSVAAMLAPGARARTGEGATQQVYGRLWDKFDAQTCIHEARAILEERFRRSEFRLPMLEGKTVLDMGCGSGRYTIALATSGARRVEGIDLGAASIDTARRMAAEAGVTNVEFRAGSVLELPYGDHEFDFVFCNGVLHHTDDMEQGIRELHRVLRPRAQAFLYLYADGGLLWYSRKRMPAIMKRVPQAYTMAVLDLIGMPHNRFIFADNWYVPIERHTSRAWLEAFLTGGGFTEIRKVVSGRASDLDSVEAMNHPDARLLWGEGEHRYLLTKG